MDKRSLSPREISNIATKKINTLPAVDRDGEFYHLALKAFEETHRQLYAQALEESARVNRNNQILKLVEGEIFKEDVIAEMDVGQKIMLAKILLENNQTSVKALLEFGKMFKEMKSNVGMFEALQRTKGAKNLMRGKPAVEDDDFPIDDED